MTMTLWGKKFFGVYFLISFFILVSSNPQKTNIVGGKLSEEGEFPYSVGLFRVVKQQYGDYYYEDDDWRQMICTGSITSPKVIITAAHCVENFLSFANWLKNSFSSHFSFLTGNRYLILLYAHIGTGTTDISYRWKDGNEVKGKFVQVESVEIHPGLIKTNERYIHDVAKLYLVEEVEESSTIKYLITNSSMSNFTDYKGRFYVAGFGQREDDYFDNDNDDSFEVNPFVDHQLRHLDFAVYDYEKCVDRFRNNSLSIMISEENHICLTSDDSEVNSESTVSNSYANVCYGDSGSALVIKKGNGIFSLEGVSSFITGNIYENIFVAQKWSDQLDFYEGRTPGKIKSVIFSSITIYDFVNVTNILIVIGMFIIVCVGSTGITLVVYRYFYKKNKKKRLQEVVNITNTNQ